MERPFKGMVATLLCLTALQSPGIAKIQEDLDRALRRPPAELSRIFQRPQDAARMREMVGRRGGLTRFRATVFPSPPGHEGVAPYFAVISTRQDIQEDWDMVAPVFTGPDTWVLGPEILEDADRSFAISRVFSDVRFTPAEVKVEARSVVQLSGGGLRAPLFRINENYQVGKVEWNGQNLNIVEAGRHSLALKEGDVLRAGGLLIPWTKSAGKTMKVWTEAKLTAGNEDSIGAEHAHVTAWWVPSAGRLPHDFSCRVVGPKDWELRSEGELGRREPDSDDWPVGPDQKEVFYQSKFPISFPKAMGGKYQLAAERKVGERVLRAWQFAPIDKSRAERDVQRMADGLEFFEKVLGPWPYSGYECFDARQYYGIESYSYTLLAPGITTTFVTHEMAHTYLGGIVPCSYIHDSWNEGLTQYIDGVVLLKNDDRTLESAIRGLNVTTPLNQMGVAHGHGGNSYWRGAYVMKMLEAEIGAENVLKGFRRLVETRAGKETRWADVRKPFEEVSGQDLDWFWKQWVEVGTFPSLRGLRMESVNAQAPFQTRVTVQQSGSPRPYRLRFEIILTGAGTGANVPSQTFPVTMSAGQESFVLTTPFRPTSARLNGFGLTLARASNDTFGNRP